jgi:hypothetical protein
MQIKHNRSMEVPFEAPFPYGGGVLPREKGADVNGAEMEGPGSR